MTPHYKYFCGQGEPKRLTQPKFSLWLSIFLYKGIYGCSKHNGSKGIYMTVNEHTYFQLSDKILKTKTDRKLVRVNLDINQFIS